MCWIHCTWSRCFLLKMSAACNFCKKPSELKCGNCREVSYCCKEHQKEDWKNHKLKCSPYKVVSNEKIGRHLIAVRAISEGEIIIKEAPIIAGPAQITPPVCLGCYEVLTELKSRDCSTCGWPVCSEICEKSKNHNPECEITSKYKTNKVKIKTFGKELSHPSYQCLTVLRCLHLKNSQPKLWEKLMTLESHCEERKFTVKYNSDQSFIADFIPKFFNFNEFSKEEILKVAGIVQVNAHEVPLREPGYIAIYERASFLEHSCKANCLKSFTNSGELVIRAAGRISPGDHLSICYTDPLWGREMRMNHLLETKFFLCQCPRCADPIEFGTHFNSLLCTTGNCDGYLVPSYDLKSEETKNSRIKITSWQCQKCSATVAEKGHALIGEIYDCLTTLDKTNAKSCTEFLEKYKKYLHHNHNLLVGIKLALIDIYAWQAQLLTVSDPELEWTLKSCKEVYALITSLTPAENRLRGVLLYQLHLALMEYGRRKAAREEIQPQQTTRNLLECKTILSKAYTLLCYEPDELPEGKMAIEAKKALENLQRYLLESQIEN